ncbi:MAG TPA: hypothetical protein VFT64_08895 [Rickettsiales bacterium]|nr:hypothetical protein [Rickettsiales bacterium]
MAGNYNPEDEAYFRQEQEAQIDQMIAQAVEAAAKGENVEQLQEVMFSNLPAGQKDKIKKKFAEALKKRGLRQPSGEADVPSKSTLIRMKLALAVTARQAMERVMLLVRARPDVANAIKQAGQTLARNGVTVDRIGMSETELGQISPVSVGQAQTRGDTGRGY